MMMENAYLGGKIEFRISSVWVVAGFSTTAGVFFTVAVLVLLLLVVAVVVVAGLLIFPLAFAILTRIGLWYFTSDVVCILKLSNIYTVYMYTSNSIQER